MCSWPLIHRESTKLSKTSTNKALVLYIFVDRFIILFVCLSCAFGFGLRLCVSASYSFTWHYTHHGLNAWWIVHNQSQQQNSRYNNHNLWFAETQYIQPYVHSKTGQTFWQIKSTLLKWPHIKQSKTFLQIKSTLLKWPHTNQSKTFLQIKSTLLKWPHIKQSKTFLQIKSTLLKWPHINQSKTFLQIKSTLLKWPHTKQSKTFLQIKSTLLKCPHTKQSKTFLQIKSALPKWPHINLTSQSQITTPRCNHTSTFTSNTVAAT